MLSRKLINLLIEPIGIEIFVKRHKKTVVLGLLIEPIGIEIQIQILRYQGILCF